MFDWLEEGLLHHHGPLTLGDLATRLALSLLLGLVVAGIYVLTLRKPRAEIAPFVTTLVLLTLLITMVTLVIGNSVARAFSLVGALSIVRFRTVVEDTRDTAFVIFAVIVGMAIGAGFPLISLFGIPFVGVAAWLLTSWGSGVPLASVAFSLSIRLGLGYDPKSILCEFFDKHFTLVRLQSATTARGGAALDFSYHVHLRREQEVAALITELTQLQGVQNVELHRLK